MELGGDWPAFCRALSCSPSSHRSQSDPTPPNPITSSPCCNAQTPKQHPQGAAQTPDLDPRGPGRSAAGAVETPARGRGQQDLRCVLKWHGPRRHQGTGLLVSRRQTQAQAAGWVSGRAATGHQSPRVGAFPRRAGSCFEWQLSSLKEDVGLQ